MLSTLYHTKKYTSPRDISVCLHAAVSLEEAETGLRQKQWKGKARCHGHNPKRSRSAQKGVIYSISYYSWSNTHTTCQVINPLPFSSQLLFAGTQLICWAAHNGPEGGASETGWPSPGNVFSQVIFLVRSGRSTASIRQEKGMSKRLLTPSDNSTHF